MILPRPEDAMHKTQILRLLMGIIDTRPLSHRLLLKGGTCAALAGWLDRFSLDLDFDLAPRSPARIVKQELLALFARLRLTVTKHNDLFFVLQYPARPGERNSMKVSVTTRVARANTYAPLYLLDIARYALCQTRETMVANKLVVPMDRFERSKTIAGRDVYDIHYFLSRGFGLREEVIRERRGEAPKTYLAQLIDFIDRRVTDRVIAEDLNYLLPPGQFQAVRKTLKDETLVLLRDARSRA